MSKIRLRIREYVNVSRYHEATIISASDAKRLFTKTGETNHALGPWNNIISHVKDLSAYHVASHHEIA